MRRTNKLSKEKCPICLLSPFEREKLEVELLRGNSYAKIGREFGIDPFYVSNHSKEHVARQSLERSRETGGFG